MPSVGSAKTPPRSRIGHTHVPIRQPVVSAQKNGDHASAVGYYRKLHVRHPGDLGVLREGLDVLLRRRGPSFLYVWAPGQ